MGVIERKHGTYRDLDAFQVIEDGRVMVALDQPGHRLPEEYVPASQLAGAVEALRLIAGTWPSDGSWAPRQLAADTLQAMNVDPTGRGQ